MMTMTTPGRLSFIVVVITGCLLSLWMLSQFQQQCKSILAFTTTAATVASSSSSSRSSSDSSGRDVASSISSFSSFYRRNGSNIRLSISLSLSSSSTTSSSLHDQQEIVPYFLKEDDGWTSLSETRGVWWKLNRNPSPETTTTKDVSSSVDDDDDDGTPKIKYVGTLVGEDWWTSLDVADCWLTELQGMEQYIPQIIQNNIDASILLDPNQFTESYVETTFGITNKIQCKKFVMAAKRLQKIRTEFEMGHEFDSNQEGFDVGPSKRLIKGMRLAVDAMIDDDKALSASVVCRSDYGYGSEGLPTSNGDVIVPPFATLRFDIELL